MKVLIAFAVFISCTSNVLHAQRSCATMEVFNEMVIKDSLFRTNRRVIESLNQRFSFNNKQKLQPINLVIPVVVHVVLTDPRVVSRDQVLSQISILNDDFASTNADISAVPDAFKPLVASSLGVTFALALRTPDGKPTDGIQYHTTSVPAFNPYNNYVKFKQLGGADAWPSDQYLNIWVCDLSAGLLGYAQFPGGPTETDGVVVDYTAFGTTGTANAPFDKGRTATHEIGHWLDLYHIWGDRTSCQGDDLVDDTPTHNRPNNNCPQFPKLSCDNTPHGEMFMNYMDYVNDECMVMFTRGQAQRMQGTLFGFRMGLFTSGGLVDPQVPSIENASLKIIPY